MSKSDTSNATTPQLNRQDIDRMARERMDDRRRISALEETVEQLQAEIETLTNRVPSAEAKQYDEMDRVDKATVVCSKLRSEADSTGGRAAVKYKDIIRMFDGRPSPGHAYDIMDTAAEQDGFEIGTDPSAEKRLTYDRRRCED